MRAHTHTLARQHFDWSSLSECKEWGRRNEKNTNKKRIDLSSIVGEMLKSSSASIHFSSIRWMWRDPVNRIHAEPNSTGTRKLLKTTITHARKQRFAEATIRVAKPKYRIENNKKLNWTGPQTIYTIHTIWIFLFCCYQIFYFFSIFMFENVLRFFLPVGLGMGRERQMVPKIVAKQFFLWLRFGL